MTGDSSLSAMTRLSSFNDMEHDQKAQNSKQAATVEDSPVSTSVSSRESKQEFLTRMTSSYVYIRSKEHAWVPAQVVMSEQPTYDQSDKNSSDPSEKTVQVKVPIYQKEADIDCKSTYEYETMMVDLKDYPHQTLPLQNVDEDGQLKVVDDMVDLAFLNEPALLYNLKRRHTMGKPYTRTGDILIACNPYTWMDSLYSIATRYFYANALVWNPSSSLRNLSHLEPHIYEVSATAYYGLIRDRVDQSILVSGESGAGKTESVKLCLSHLAFLQAGPPARVEKDDVSQHATRKLNFLNLFQSGHNDQDNSLQTETTCVSPIVERILDANPLLEAFGNAQTIRNDNSSRFGKYVQLQFDIGESIEAHSVYSGNRLPSGVLAGSKCEVYLLEKSRVVHHCHVTEKNFHIFYQLLAADDSIKKEIWKPLVGTTTSSFSYMGQVKSQNVEGQAEKFRKTLDSLALVGIKGSKQQMLLRTICMVLQLGNIAFTADPTDDSKAVLADGDELMQLSQLMNVDDGMLEAAFLRRNIQVRNEEFQVALNVTKATDSRDAFAKAIYAQAFHWLVDEINESTRAEKNYKPAATTFGNIGLLDLSGFECFDRNRFEQLCINYANEKLQQKFTEDIFCSVKKEYQTEGIDFAEIVYDDNTHVLDLVESKMGLIAILNEECIRPGGSDQAFVSKIVQSQSESPCLFQKRHFGSNKFGIQHYAGPVVYDGKGFVSKNTDTLPKDIQACAKMSTNAILAEYICGNIETLEKSETRLTWKQLAKRGSDLVGVTVMTKFKWQLVELMERLSHTRSRYVRCVKPNNLKLPLLMQHITTVNQLRSAGVVSAVTVARSAFPNRVQHAVVLDRYAPLWFSKEQQSEAAEVATKLANGDSGLKEKIMVQHLLSAAMKSFQEFSPRRMDDEKQQGDVDNGFVLGHTRVYFREMALEFLEVLRLKRLGYWASQIQRVVRGFTAKQARKRTWFLIGQLAFTVNEPIRHCCLGVAEPTSFKSNRQLSAC